MSDWARTALERLRRCRLLPASFEKRFVHQTHEYAQANPEWVPSEKQVVILRRLAHRYRRQIGRCLVPDCEVCAPERARLQEIERQYDLGPHVFSPEAIEALAAAPEEPGHG